MKPIERGRKLETKGVNKDIFETNDPNKLMKVVLQEEFLQWQSTDDDVTLSWPELTETERLALMRQIYYLHKLMELVHPGFTARISGIDAKESAYLVEKLLGTEMDEPQTADSLVRTLRVNGLSIDTVGKNNFIHVLGRDQETYVDEVGIANWTTWPTAHAYFESKLNVLENEQQKDLGQYYLGEFRRYSREVDTIFENHSS